MWAEIKERGRENKLLISYVVLAWSLIEGRLCIHLKDMFGSGIMVSWYTSQKEAIEKNNISADTNIF